MMGCFADPQKSVNIVARVSPSLGQACLPADVQLVAADESQTVFSSIRSRENSPTIELRFRAEPGDYFSLTIALKEFNLTRRLLFSEQAEQLTTN